MLFIRTWHYLLALSLYSNDMLSLKTKKACVCEIFEVVPYIKIEINSGVFPRGARSSSIYI